ncbi:hypothetical protein R3P38DRAFT_3321613 [Favolaschia claudopus]|uniref:DUF6589 domain-containing protein n=1 Tax=Favolaschia claudopus TaxID=2862362 RepID=A0AAW0AUQ4_9AGAR
MDINLVDPTKFYGTPGPRTISRTNLLSTPGPPPPASTPSSQPRLRAEKKDIWKKADVVVKLITKEFRSLGRFLEVLFHCRDLSVNDPRSDSHKLMVTAFLGGQSNIGMGDIIDLIYYHPQSRPVNAHPESRHYFSPPNVKEHYDIAFARPALSTWALRLVGAELRRQIGALTQNDPANPSDNTQLRASTNGRAKDVRLATWEDLGQVSILDMASTYKRRAPGVWYITECMAAPKVGGVIVQRTRRPHPPIQVGVINCLTLSRNRYATGYLALPLAVWQFACQAHIDEKRILSRFGFTVHDTTARACLDSLTDSSLDKLRQSILEGLAKGTMYWQLVLDNVQEYCRQRDHRIGREDVLKIGTAATAILLEDCSPGAFDLQDHLNRVVRQERRELTVDSLLGAIDWTYLHDLVALHWVRILVNFIPDLDDLRREVSEMLQSSAMTKLRLRPRISIMQPLGTNAEHSTETQGMKRAILDFEKQMGLDEQTMNNQIFMIRGDGASIAAIWRIKKFLATHPSHYKAFRNRIPPGPEIWHTRWTQLNAIAANCFGPATSTDPSSLSKSATAAGAKRPSNLKKVDFFPTSRSMQLFFEARVLDCWRLHFEAEDIVEYFKDNRSSIPSFESLWETARILVRRYASQEAFNQALNHDLAESASDTLRVPFGTPWTTPVESAVHGDVEAGDVDEEEEGEKGPVDEHGEAADLEEIFSDGESAGAQKKKRKKNKKSVHVEAPDFSGDRVLANEIIFLQDMGWWMIAAHAVPDGEIGRVWEVMKLWIFNFSGSSNRNYANYLLETYCLHQYEASPEFSSAMLNNWLVNPSGKKFVECDHSQEGFNKWLEEMVIHKGGNFDDNFYRHTLAPNVLHFLRMKDQIQSAFELQPRGKTHGAPHLRNEFQQLLRMHKEDELHQFRPGRTHGHAAVNFFEKGYTELESGKLQNFIEQSTAYAEVTADEALDRLLKQVQEEELADSNREEESDAELDDGAGDGGKNIGGLIYSDDEDDSSDESDSDSSSSESNAGCDSDSDTEELPNTKLREVADDAASEEEEEQMDSWVEPEVEYV